MVWPAYPPALAHSTKFVITVSVERKDVKDFNDRISKTGWRHFHYQHETRVDSLLKLLSTSIQCHTIYLRSAVYKTLEIYHIQRVAIYNIQLYTIFLNKKARFKDQTHKDGQSYKRARYWLMFFLWLICLRIEKSSIISCHWHAK